MACTLAACGADGGQSGTGISAIRGNVVAVTGADADVSDIRVSLTSTDLTTLTDADGRFELRGDASGAAELTFERERDGLFAGTDVVIPAGGVLELQEIELDSDNGEVRPARQRVEFEGVVDALDCGGGAIRLIPKEDDDLEATVFTVEVASATIRDGDNLLACGDLRVGDRVEVDGETTDGSTLVNAVLELEDREDGEDGEEVELEGFVDALDCAGGEIFVVPKDEDSAATTYTVAVASATIRRGDATIGCGDLSVGDRVQVHGYSAGGTTVVDAEVVLEDDEDELGEGPEDGGEGPEDEGDGPEDEVDEPDDGDDSEEGDDSEDDDGDDDDAEVEDEGGEVEDEGGMER
jgi:hypothetical protein